jgi:hypothetical protein
MHTESSAFAPRPANSRSRVTNRPQKMAIDGRTELGRRVRDLAESFAQQLGGWPVLTDMQAAGVRRAAELGALAEQSRRDALRGGSVDPIALSRIEGVADRAVRRLGLPSAAGKAAAPPDLKAYLAALPKEPVAPVRTPAAPSSPFERARVGDRVPLNDGREIEVVSDDELEPPP